MFWTRTEGLIIISSLLIRQMVTDTSILAFPGDDILKYLLVVTDFYYKTFDYTWLLELSLEQAARFRRKCLIFIRKPQRM